MVRFSLKLTERYDVAQRPANNLALTLAFAGVGLLNGILPLMLGSAAELARLTVLHVDADFDVIASVTDQPVERLAMR